MKEIFVRANPNAIDIDAINGDHIVIALEKKKAVAKLVRIGSNGDVSQDQYTYAFDYLQNTTSWWTGSYASIKEAIVFTMNRGFEVIVLDDISELKNYL